MWSSPEVQREYEDAMVSEHMSTGELMSLTSQQYHARGENCPWDCYSCPGTIASDLADAEAANEEWWASLTAAEQASVEAAAAEREAREAAYLAELAATNPPF